MRTRRRILVLLSVVWAFHLTAQDRPNPGDLLILGNCSSSLGFPICGAFVTVFTPQLTHRFSAALRVPNGASQVFAGGVLDILYDPLGDLHVATGDVPGLLRYSPNFEFRSSAFVPGSFALAMDSQRTVFALTFSGGLVRQEHDGTLSEIRLPLSPGYRAHSGDLGTDQCTFFYTESPVFGTSGSPHLKRFDLCRRVPLADSPVELQACAAPPEVRVSLDDTVFVSNCSVVHRLTAAGINALALPPSHISRGLAISSDGRFLWSVSTGTTIVQMDTATGLLVRSAPLGLSSAVSGLAIYGVPRASAQIGALAIPIRSVHLLLALGVALATIGCLYLRAS